MAQVLRATVEPSRTGVIDFALGWCCICRPSIGSVSLVMLCFSMQRSLGRGPRSTGKDLRELLAAYLVLFLGLAPAAQLAHLADLDHGHRFCDEHRQIEDLQHGAAVVGNGLPASASIEGNQAATARGVPGTQGEAHVACSLLNHGTSRTSLPFPAQAPAAIEHARVSVLECLRQEGFATCPLLRSAPKTSPPFVVA